MQLIIDVGNTNTKLGVFENRTLVYSELTTDLSKELIDSISEKYQVNKVAFAASGDVPIFLQEDRFLKIHRNSKLPFKNNYNSKNTVGLDRLANVSAVCHSNKNYLVIDLGTCITYDLIDCTNTYQGGVISPGLQMRFRAMSNFTSELPLLTPDWEINLPGKTTEECMKLGVMSAVKIEISGFINEFSSKYEDLSIILTGGDSKFFDKLTKSTIFVDPHLTLTGLNNILLHNE